MLSATVKGITSEGKLVAFNLTPECPSTGYFDMSYFATRRLVKATLEEDGVVVNQYADPLLGIGMRMRKPIEVKPGETKPISGFLGGHIAIEVRALDLRE